MVKGSKQKFLQGNTNGQQAHEEILNIVSHLDATEMQIKTMRYNCTFTRMVIVEKKKMGKEQGLVRMQRN